MSHEYYFMDGGKSNRALRKFFVICFCGIISHTLDFRSFRRSEMRRDGIGVRVIGKLCFQIVFDFATLRS